MAIQSWLILFSTLVLVIIGLGVAFRKRATIHIPLMASAFVLDLALLLYIEFTRHAVEKLGETLQTATPDGLLYFHVSVSALTLVLYIVQIMTGIRLFKGGLPNPALHRNYGMLFLTCRLLNYVTSFFVIQ